MPHPDDITRLLEEAGEGSENAVERLYPVIYDELRRVAQRQLSGERPDHTLQATALVNEAYLKLIDQTRVEWKNRAHFFAVAARAIRRILVDYARARNREKRGGKVSRVPLEEIAEAVAIPDDTNLVALNEALDQLAKEDPVKAQIVELRFFGGLTTGETASILDTPKRTVERQWQFARAWLFRYLSEDDTPRA